MRNLAAWMIALGLLTGSSLGCRNLTYSDQGTLLGGVGGAGVGALIGEAAGHNAGPGAIIGAGLGAIGGSLVGNGLDEIEARNRAQIAAQLGRQIPQGGATVPDVMSMVGAGVHEQLIVNHIRANGTAAPLTAQDVIALQQQGVSPNVIAAMQSSPPKVASYQQVAPPGAPVIVQQPYYGYGPPPPPYWYAPPPPHFYYHHHHRRAPRTSVGFTIAN